MIWLIILGLALVALVASATPPEPERGLVELPRRASAGPIRVTDASVPLFSSMNPYPTAELQPMPGWARISRLPQCPWLGGEEKASTLVTSRQGEPRADATGAPHQGDRMYDRETSLEYWSPVVRDLGMPVPATEIVTTEANGGALMSILDGSFTPEEQAEVEKLVAGIQAAKELLPMTEILKEDRAVLRTVIPGIEEDR